MDSNQFDETQTIVLSTTQDEGDSLSGTQNTQSTTTQSTHTEDSDDSSTNSGDFTQHTRTLHKEQSSQLLNKVKATAYFMAAIDAKEKRANRTKKLEVKERNRKMKHKKYAEGAQALLANMNCNIETVSTPVPKKKSRKLVTKVETSAVKTSNRSSSKKQSRFAVHSDVKTPKVNTPNQLLPFTTPSPCATTSISIRKNITLMSHPCSGCGRTVDECHELKYRNMCLHAVLDYFDEVGFQNVTQLGIYNSYARTYTFALKKDMLEHTTFYERTLDIEIPDCMENGSLEEAQQINRSNRLFQFLMSKRVYDVEVYFDQLKSGNIDAAFFSNVENDNKE